MTPFANRFGVANLAYWVTGTEGSNPSLSAIRSVLSAYYVRRELFSVADPAGVLTV